MYSIGKVSSLKNETGHNPQNLLCRPLQKFLDAATPPVSFFKEQKAGPIRYRGIVGVISASYYAGHQSGLGVTLRISATCPLFYFYMRQGRIGITRYLLYQPFWPVHLGAYKANTSISRLSGLWSATVHIPRYYFGYHTPPVSFFKELTLPMLYNALPQPDFTTLR